MSWSSGTKMAHTECISKAKVWNILETRKTQSTLLKEIKKNPNGCICPRSTGGADLSVYSPPASRPVLSSLPQTISLPRPLGCLIHQASHFLAKVMAAMLTLFYLKEKEYRLCTTAFCTLSHFYLVCKTN